MSVDLYVLIRRAGTALRAQTAQQVLAESQAAVHCCRLTPALSASRRSNKKDDAIFVNSTDYNSSDSSNKFGAILVRPTRALTTC